MMLCRLVCVLFGMGQVSMRHVRVMRSSEMIARLMMPGSFRMMVSRLFMVMGSLPVMMDRLF